MSNLQSEEFAQLKRSNAELLDALKSLLAFVNSCGVETIGKPLPDPWSDDLAQLKSSNAELLDTLRRLLAFATRWGLAFEGKSMEKVMEKYLEAYEPLSKAYNAIQHAEGKAP